MHYVLAGFQTEWDTTAQETSRRRKQALQFWNSVILLCVCSVFVVFLVCTQKIQVQHTGARSGGPQSVGYWWSPFAGSGGTKSVLERHGDWDSLSHVSLRKNTNKHTKINLSTDHSPIYRGISLINPWKKEINNVKSQASYHMADKNKIYVGESTTMSQGDFLCSGPCVVSPVVAAMEVWGGQ